MYMSKGSELTGKLLGGNDLPKNTQEIVVQLSKSQKEKENHTKKNAKGEQEAVNERHRQYTLSIQMINNAITNFVCTNRFAHVLSSHATQILIT